MRFVLLFLGALLGGIGLAAAAEPVAQLRHPVSVALSRNGAWLYTANARAGTISAVEVASGQVRSETPVGAHLAGLVRLDDTHWLTLDGARHELVLCECLAEKVTVRARTAVAKYPVALAVMPHGRTVVVTSLWSRRVTFVAYRAQQSELQATGMLDLDFAPRNVLALDAQHALVADAFAGQLAVVQATEQKISRQLRLEAHNIRGLALAADGQQVFVAHSFLNEEAQAFHNDITWGVLTANSVHVYPTAAILAGDDLNKVSELHELGIPGQGGADPAEVAVAEAGCLVVPLSGAGQVAFCMPAEIQVARVPAGNYPTAVTLSGDLRTAYVAHTYDDTIGVYDVPRRTRLREISLGPQPALTAADRGERLFHNGRLAHDRWMSCQTCHTDGHTNGAVNDNRTDGAFGNAKRVPSLLGCRDTAPYAWNGQVATLEEQMRLSITSTMQGKYQVADDEASALAAYLRTLEPPPALAAARGELKPEAIARGKELFHALDCKSCHTPPTYTSPATYDVGLTEAGGGHEFNPPALRGLSQRVHLFHDNRAASVEEVIGKFKHQLSRELTAAEAANLAAFLRSL